MAVEMLIPLVVTLGIAVYWDVTEHRIPNLLLCASLLASLITHQVLGATIGSSISAWAVGLGAGFFCFIPIYALGGMAAGDVKLMAVVGSYFTAINAIFAGLLTLIFGALIGIGILAYKGQLRNFVVRYMAMVGARTYIHPPISESAAYQKFPYAIAIALGSITSFLWPHV